MQATVRSYTPEDRTAFFDLNEAWILKHFEMEDKDRDMLKNPQAAILDKGGEILIAELDGRAVGTVALVPVTADRFELCKMAVDESARGNGIGRALMDAAERVARDQGASSIWLETNTVLGPALALYTSAGYVEATGEDFIPSPYDRCNIQFVKRLS